MIFSSRREDAKTRRTFIRRHPEGAKRPKDLWKWLVKKILRFAQDDSNEKITFGVIPAKAGIHRSCGDAQWTPASAGVTAGVSLEGSVG